MAEHTPGPWRAEQIEETKRGRTTYHWSIWAGTRIAVIDDQIGHEDIANARLIAAAPDLLAACQAELEVYDGMDAATLMPKTLARIAALRAAVEKAIAVSLPEAQ